MPKTCINHPAVLATHTVVRVDLDTSTEHERAYKRVPVCGYCAAYAGNTDRLEEIHANG